MAAPQLSVRSEKAIEVAHRLSQKTGRTIGDLVEEALTDMEAKMIRESEDKVEAFWEPVTDLLEEGKRVAKEKRITSTDDDEFFDKIGLPKL